MTLKRLLFIGAATSLLFVGCGKEETKSISPSYATLYSEVFSKRCIECHKPGGSATADGANINFTTASAGYFSMVGVSVSGTSSIAGGCTGRKIITAGTPSASYLLAVFFSDYGLGSSNFGGAGCTPYNHTGFANSIPTSSEKASIVQWISEGAQNN